MEQALKSLELQEFKNLMTGDIIILDTRHETEFVNGYIPSSINIGLSEKFVEWAGSLLPWDNPILLVTEPGKEKETITHLDKTGFNKVQGYLNGGYETWKNAGEKFDLIIEVEPDELLMDMSFDKNLVVLDVRNETEFADGHLPEAINLPLNQLNDPANMGNIEDHHNLYVHCGSGNKSVIASSLLKRQGIHNLRNVVGGWNAIKKLEKVEVVKEKSVSN
jgi:rhodanese-related sulfurtransferase